MTPEEIFFLEGGELTWAGKSRDYCDYTSFSKSAVFKMFPSTRACLFNILERCENLRFHNGLVWMVGQTIVITKQNKRCVKTVQVV